jgi:hypothetical protein
LGRTSGALVRLGEILWELVGLGNYWKEDRLVVVEAGVRRGERPTTADRETAISGSPFLVSARWENNKASVRWPSEKKGWTQIKHTPRKARSVLDNGQPVKEKELYL